jgi:hypothetical protein
VQDDPAGQQASNDQPTYSTSNFLEDIFASMDSQVTTILIHSAYFSGSAYEFGASESELLFLLQDFNPDATLLGEEY